MLCWFLLSLLLGQIEAQCSSLSTCSSCLERAECCWTFGQCVELGPECPGWLPRKCPTVPFPTQSFPSWLGPQTVNVYLPSYVSVSPSLDLSLTTSVGCSASASCSVSCRPGTPSLLSEVILETESTEVAVLASRAFVGQGFAGVWVIKVFPHN